MAIDHVDTVLHGALRSAMVSDMLMMQQEWAENVSATAFPAVTKVQHATAEKVATMPCQCSILLMMFLSLQCHAVSNTQSDSHAFVIAHRAYAGSIGNFVI